MTLILLLLFIYAALGINLFSQVMLQDNLNDKNNFQDFWRALIILMSFSTGEDWNSFMFELAASDASVDGQHCSDDAFSYDVFVANGKVTNKCGAPIAYLYFFTFTVLVSILIMNLSVAAVIEGLDTAKKENMGVVTSEEIDEMLDMW
jgi:voltage-dependent calcium channel L type alpha-1D